MPKDTTNETHKLPIAFGKLVKNINVLIPHKKVIPEAKPEISEELQKELNEFFDIIIEKVFKIVDDEVKKQRINEIYGNNLGIVHPSVWPIDENTKKSGDDASVSSVSSEFEESDEAESVSTTDSYDDSK